MLASLKKNLFFSVVLLSTALYTTDDYNHDKKETTKSEESSKTFDEPTLDILEPTDTDENFKQGLVPDLCQPNDQDFNLEELLKKAKEKSKEVVLGVVDSKRISDYRTRMMNLGNNESFNLRSNESFNWNVNKIGLGSAIFGALFVLGCNHLTKPGNIRNRLMFRRMLGLSTGYLVYKLVATNDAVKQDICNAVAKLKRD